ncbi:hypothetical protein QIG84_25480 [Klebsiella pneumoniae]|uniref:hypothetical protein n=1 Tax=Klebsiella pneumoniae TaxID=573 RepID=UPI00214BDF6A|nr:hypothetical protein [Klebsiella pneumoniae]MDH8457815.1 hypothetical protein [Klebsiella pneumoniae]
MTRLFFGAVLFATLTVNANYSYGDDCINSETGPISQTCENADVDVDVAQEKKSLSERTPDNSTSVHGKPPAEVEDDSELTEEEDSRLAP